MRKSKRDLEAFTPGTCFLLTILVDPWVGKLYSKPFLFATIYPMLELPVPISDLAPRVCVYAHGIPL